MELTERFYNFNSLKDIDKPLVSYKEWMSLWESATPKWNGNTFVLTSKKTKDVLFSAEVTGLRTVK